MLYNIAKVYKMVFTYQDAMNDMSTHKKNESKD